MMIASKMRLAMAVALLVSVGSQASSANDERFDCLIEPIRVFDLGAEVQGVIDRIEVDTGDLISQGQTLVVLKAALQRAKMNQAISRLKMNSEINAREADVKLARQVLSRLEKLHSQELVSEQEIEEAQTRLHLSQAALNNARDNRVMLQHDLLRYETELNQRIIKSPVAGVVQRRHADPGELVTDSPVVTIAQIDLLKVTVVLPAANVGRFNVGARAMVFPELSGEQPTSAMVQSIDPVLDAGSGTFGITLVLNNEGASIVAGQECTVQFAGYAG